MSDLQDLTQNYRVLISATLCAISVNFFTLSDFVQTCRFHTYSDYNVSKGLILIFHVLFNSRSRSSGAWRSSL